MAPVCASCGWSLSPADIYCGNCGRATAGQAEQIAETAQVPDYEPVPATWFSLSSTSEELDRARSAPVSPREPEAGDMPWWESRLPLPAPPEPVWHDVPGPRGTRNAPPRPQRSQAAPQSCITTDDRKKSYAELGVPEALGPLSSSRFLGQLARRFALCAVVAAVADCAYFVLGLTYFLVGKHSAVLAAAPDVYLLSVVVLLLGFLLLPVPALLGHWSRLLSFQGPAAETALDCVAGALEAHGTPSDKLGIRLLSPPGEGRRHVLELRRGYFAGYVSCFPHGHDLYVGWTFWIQISPIRVLLLRIGRKAQDYPGRGNDRYQTLRFESARATVAAIHACTLEGVDAATGEVTVPGLRTAGA